MLKWSGLVDNKMRAEKIAQKWNPSVIEDDNISELISDITSQLDEAVREVDNFQAMRVIEVEKYIAANAFAQGFVSAREKAAGIVEKCVDSNSSDALFSPLAERIRAMGPEESK